GGAGIVEAAELEQAVGAEVEGGAVLRLLLEEALEQEQRLAAAVLLDAHRREIIEETRAVRLLIEEGFVLLSGGVDVAAAKEGVGAVDARRHVAGVRLEEAVEGRDGAVELLGLEEVGADEGERL